MHRSSSLHSSTQSRDSKCRSTYDNYGPVIETSEPSISSSNEFLESEPPLTSITESKTDLDQISSSSNDNIKPISSSISSKPSIQSTSHVRVDSERYFIISPFEKLQKSQIIDFSLGPSFHKFSRSQGNLWTVPPCRGSLLIYFFVVLKAKKMKLSFRVHLVNFIKLLHQIIQAKSKGQN